MGDAQWETCGAETLLEEFFAQVRRRLGVETVHINYVGPVIGNHSGPGTMALFFLGSER